jgi:hypothetical protein
VLGWRLALEWSSSVHEIVTKVDNGRRMRVIDVALAQN